MTVRVPGAPPIAVELTTTDILSSTRQSPRRPHRPNVASRLRNIQLHNTTLPWRWGVSVITDVYRYVEAHDNNPFSPRQRVHHFEASFQMYYFMRLVVSCLKTSESNHESNKHYASIDSDDGLEPNRQHAIIWASADTERWCIHRWYSGKPWCLQGNCVGDPIVHH